MKYGKIAQIRNIMRWLQNYQKTGYRLCDVTEKTSDKQIQERARKLIRFWFIPKGNVNQERSGAFSSVVKKLFRLG